MLVLKTIKMVYQKINLKKLLLTFYRFLKYLEITHTQESMEINKNKARLLLELKLRDSGKKTILIKLQ